VVLFSSGVGYFQREAPSKATPALTAIPTANINDLLKSLILHDGNGGKSALELRQPQSHRDDLADVRHRPDAESEPGRSVNQARGEEVEVHAAEIIRGHIVGVERQRQRIGQDMVEHVQLNLLTQDGLRGVNLSRSSASAFSSQAWSRNFRKALEVLATGHDKLKKTVSLISLEAAAAR